MHAFATTTDRVTGFQAQRNHPRHAINPSGIVEETYHACRGRQTIKAMAAGRVPATSPALSVEDDFVCASSYRFSSTRFLSVLRKVRYNLDELASRQCPLSSISSLHHGTGHIHIPVLNNFLW